LRRGLWVASSWGEADWLSSGSTETSATGRSVPADVVRIFGRATDVQHHRRIEPSATNAANAGRRQYQRNLPVTSTANDARKTFSRQWAQVRSLHRPPAVVRPPMCARVPRGPPESANQPLTNRSALRRSGQWRPRVR
jgi:hypothetical protein